MLGTNGCDVWDTFGWVDAVSSFGAKLRSDWRLILTTDQKVQTRYTVLYYRIGDDEVGDLSAVRIMLDSMKEDQQSKTNSL